MLAPIGRKSPRSVSGHALSHIEFVLPNFLELHVAIMVVEADAHHVLGQLDNILLAKH